MEPRSSWGFALIVSCLASCATPGDKPPSASAPSRSAAAVPEAPVAPTVSRDWSARPDFSALRQELGARDDFGESCELSRPLKQAFEQLEAERWSDLLALTEPWVERCAIDMDAHMLRAIALGESGRASEAEDHRAWARGLLESVLATGDGQTPASAYQVIAVFEEYSVLRLLRFEPKGQTLVAGGIDAMTVSGDGEETTIYFDPAASHARILKELEEQAPTP